MKRYLGAIAVLVLALAPVAMATDPGTVTLISGGNVNGQQVDASHYWITVDPGQSLTGVIAVEATNNLGANAVAPLGYTVTWGDRIAQPVCSDSWISTGVNDFSISIDKTAPTTPGDYYIVLSFAGRYDIGQVMSNTTAGLSAKWNDGNDLGWDWTATNYQECRDAGKTNVMIWLGDVEGYGPYAQAANWVGVTVTPEPATLSLLALGGAALLRRRNGAK